MIVKYGITVEMDGEPIHWVGYEKPPKYEDFESLYIELHEGKEFSYSEEMLESAVYRKSTPEEIEFMNECMKNEKE